MEEHVQGERGRNGGGSLTDEQGLLVPGKNESLLEKPANSVQKH